MTLECLLMSRKTLRPGWSRRNVGRPRSVEPLAPEESDAPPFDVSDTVEELRDTVGDLLTREAGRAQSLDARSTWLAGFCGVVMSLSANIGLTILKGVSGGARSLVLILHVLSVALLLAAALLALSALLPRASVILSIREVERYPLPEFFRQAKYLVQGRALRGFIESLRHDRAIGDRKARRFRGAVAVLSAGLICVALEASVAALLVEAS